MNEQPWHPYAPDQEFGWRAARDERALDAILGWASAHHAEQPVTCAVALEAAAQVREHGDG
jgi:hypothetical protein